MKKIKFPKPKRVKKSTLKNKADKLFSLKIRKVGFCQLEGLDDINCGGSLQCMHIIGRSNHSLRWDDKNAICGCAGHHRYYTSHPLEFYELIKRVSADNYRYLLEHKNEIWDKDIERILEALQ